MYAKSCVLYAKNVPATFVGALVPNGIVVDRTVLFDEILALAGPRERTYEVLEAAPGSGLVCVDLSARRGPDWFFARRWILVREGRRLLYRTLDRIEAAGYAFRVRPRPRLLPEGQTLDPAWGNERASRLRQELDEEERHLNDELFPEAAGLLSQGYDWDARTVYKHGQALPRDAYGRVLESTPHAVWEWVCVPDELTWRRYPLQRIARATWASLGIRR